MTQLDRIQHITGLKSKEKVEAYLKKVHINISLETYEKLELIELCESILQRMNTGNREVENSDNADVFNEIWSEGS